MYIRSYCNTQLRMHIMFSTMTAYDYGLYDVPICTLYICAQDMMAYVIINITECLKYQVQISYMYHIQ